MDGQNIYRPAKSKKVRIKALIEPRYYYISGSDLILLKDACNSTPFLDFGLFLLAAVIGLLTFLQSTVMGNTLFIITVCLIVIFSFSSIIFIVLWLKGRKKLNSILRTIKRQKLESA
jgi:hypothetical protein